MPKPQQKSRANPVWPAKEKRIKDAAPSLVAVKLPLPPPESESLQFPLSQVQ